MSKNQFLVTFLAKKKKKTERKKRLRVDEESRRLVGTSSQCSEDV